MASNAPGGNTPVAFIDNPHAPDVFADACTGVFLWNGNIRLTFESDRVNHATSPGPINRVVIGRLVMPVVAAQEMIKMLQGFIEQQQQAPNAPPQATGTVH
ncbi:MAG: hypothetical protein GEU76_06290 [Alphaproteobacteria bacterium]|jgi:hypothetical protein|nr:hypothetical protein [Alphaproteobacteria bacterium]